VRVPLAGHGQELFTVYTGGFRAYEPFDDGEFTRKYVVRGDAEYATDEVHIKTCESHEPLLYSGSPPTAEFQKTNSPSISERFSFTANSSPEPGKEALKQLSEPRSEINNSPTRARNACCLTVLYLPSLPIHTSVTVRFLLALYPIVLYGVNWLDTVREGVSNRVITVHLYLRCCPPYCE